MERIEGIVAVWLPARAFGFIVTEEKEVRRFFMHLSHITKGADDIAVGKRATFTVSPIREGKNPTALDVEILTDNVIPATGGAL
jgi:cold shock CspA family protein